MALRNPGGLYTGGAVTLNPLPYVNIALQARAKKAAKEEAINSYYTKLPNTINEKGLRDQEVPILHDLKGQIFEFGVKNREALKNPRLDNGAAQLKIEQMFRDATAISTYSKNAAQGQLEAGKAYFGKDGWLVNDDDFIEASRRAELPVNNPEYQPLDLPKLMQNKPFDPVSFGKDIKTRFKYGEGTPNIIPHPTDKNLEVVTTNPQLDKDTKTGIYAYAADLLHSNKAFKKKIESDLKTGDQFPLLQEISRRVFNKEIETDEDIAAAYTYSQLPTSTTKAKVIPSIDAKNNEWDRRSAVGLQNAFKRQENWARLNADKKQAESPHPPNVLDEITVANGQGYKNPFTGEDVTYVEEKDIPVNYRKTVFQGLSPVEIGDKKVYIVRKDGEYEGKDGKIITPVAASDAFVKNFGNTKLKLEARRNFKSANPVGNKVETKPALPKSKPTVAKPTSDPLKLF